MPLEARLRGHAPRDLVAARAAAHQAAQLIGDAARANLDHRPDYSHTSLDWEPLARRLRSLPLADVGRIALSFAPLSLHWRDGESGEETLALAGLSLAETRRWLDARLADARLAAATPVEAPALDAFAADLDQTAETALEAWFELAAGVFSAFASANAAIAPGPSPVRCWPHHFDIATYVALEDGDPETARGVGVGLSPGDESFDQPYFYVTPWPAPSGASPDAPPPGVWLSEGFVGFVATAEALQAEPTRIAPRTGAFLAEAFDASRRILAA